MSTASEREAGEHEQGAINGARPGRAGLADLSGLDRSGGSASDQHELDIRTPGALTGASAGPIAERSIEGADDSARSPDDQTPHTGSIEPNAPRSWLAGLRGSNRSGVLRHRHFRNVWYAAFGSSVGGWMEMVGIQWSMAEAALSAEWVRSGGASAPVMMGYLAVAHMAPTLVLGMVGGVLADRINRKKLLIWTQVMLMLVAVVLTVESARGAITPWLLLGLSVVNGVVAAFNIPAWQVLTPRLVPREELTAAITLNGVQFNLARVIGPALGGMILANFGATWLYAVNSLSFLGVILAVMSTPDAPAPPRTGERVWREIGHAIRFSLTDKGARCLLLGLFLFCLLATPMIRMLPILVSEVYHAQADAFGMLLAVMGAGAVTGFFVLRSIPRWYPKHHSIPIAIMCGGIFVTMIAAATSLWLAAAAIFLCGVTWLLSFNPSFAALQMLVDDRMRGRVLAFANVVTFGAMPLGAVLVGWIGEFASGRSGDGFGTQVGLGALGVVLTFAGFVMLAWRTPEVDGVKPGDPGYERQPGLWRGLSGGVHRPTHAHAGPPAAGSRAGVPPSSPANAGD